jgi:hypothetical protein
LTGERIPNEKEQTTTGDVSGLHDSKTSTVDRMLDASKAYFQARVLLGALFQPRGVALDEIDCDLEKRTEERLALDLLRGGLVEPDGGRRHRRWYPTPKLIELVKSLIAANPPVFDEILAQALGPQPGPEVHEGASAANEEKGTPSDAVAGMEP